jgi:hypothetical protein
MTPRARERTRPRARLAALLALSLAPGSGACSFYKVRPPPPPSEWPEPVLPSSSEEKCTATIGPPIADTVIGVTFGTIAYIERNATKFEYDYKTTPPVLVPTADNFSRGIALTFGIAAVPYLASAIWGYVETSRCRRYQSLFRH